jgi:hypothetical protein
VEIGAVAIALVSLFFFIEFTPFLVASGQDNSIGVYKEKEFGNGNVTITKGQIVRAPYFNYSTFDPAILVVDMDFQSWQSVGTLKLAVNGKVFATVVATPEKPKLSLSVISVSGADWVDPTSIYDRVYGNAISFASEAIGGFEGTFNYQINIRGSR